MLNINKIITNVNSILNIKLNTIFIKFIKINKCWMLNVKHQILSSKHYI